MSTIQGKVWNDIDGDTIQDSNEPGISGWTIYLDQNNNNQLDPGEITTITNATGSYLFTDLAAGKYTVAEVTTAGWEKKFPNSAQLFGNDSIGNIYTVNPLTGQASNSRSTGLYSLIGVTYTNGVLYGVTPSGYYGQEKSLYKINPATGVTTKVGYTGLRQLIEGDLDIDPTTGNLYGVKTGLLPMSPAALFFIDAQTGQATIVGEFGLRDLSAMTFDSAGNLYALDTSNDQLLTIDPQLGEITSVVSLSLDLGLAAGMDFNPITGQLFVADGIEFQGGFQQTATNTLYTLDLSNGVLTRVGSLLASKGLAGLSFAKVDGHNVTLAANQTISNLNFGNRSGTPANDVLIGTAGADILDGRIGNDRIQGRAGNDLLKGSEGNDALYGESGNDTLQGGVGNDALLGSIGTDTLVGGSGADQFIFDMNAAFQSTIGVDIIQDFVAGSDRLVLDQTTFTTLGSTVSFATVTTLAKAQTSPALITYIAATGALYYNANGNSAGFGTGGQFADLSDSLTLAASNFLIRS